MRRVPPGPWETPKTAPLLTPEMHSLGVVVLALFGELAKLALFDAELQRDVSRLLSRVDGLERLRVDLNELHRQASLRLPRRPSS